MKKIYLLLAFLCAALSTRAQNIMFNYQAVARDLNNQPYKTTPAEAMTVGISIVDDNKKELYSEDFENVATSQLGIFNLLIGTGKNKAGKLEDIDWTASKPLFLAATIKLGNSFEKSLPQSQLVYVPFSIFAVTADNLKDPVGGDLSGPYRNAQLNPQVVGTAELADVAVTNGKIAGMAVDNGKLAGDAVTSDKIKDKEVMTEDLADGAVTNDKMKNLAVTDDKIAGGIDYAKLSGGTAGMDQVLKWNGTVWEPKPDNTATASSLSAGGAQIMGTLSDLKIKAGAVGSSEIADGSITGADIMDGTVGGSDLKSTINLSASGLSLVGEGGLFKLVGTTHGYMEFYPQGVPIGRKGWIGYNQGNNDLQITNESATGKIILNPSDVVEIYGKGLNVIGAHDRFADYAFLANVKRSLDHYHNYGGNTGGAVLFSTNKPDKLEVPVDYASDNASYSIESSNRILATEFNATSDLRVKHIIGTSHRQQDRVALEKIAVRDFYYKDMVAHGTQSKKGFIAQEVEKIFPEAVSHTTDFIPDIYQVARQVQYDPARRSLRLTVDSLTGGLQAGDRLRIIADQQREATVSAVQGNTITVQDWPVADTQEAFVYGKQVNDFCVVDYDRIFTLNVSVTQALIQEVDDLKAQVAALQAQNTQLARQNASIQSLEARLNALAARIEAGAGIGPTEAENGKEKK